MLIPAMKIAARRSRVLCWDAQDRISQRLDELCERSASVAAPNAKALVVVKDAAVQAKLDELGIKLRKVSSCGGVLESSSYAGRTFSGGARQLWAACIRPQRNAANQMSVAMSNKWQITVDGEEETHIPICIHSCSPGCDQEAERHSARVKVRRVRTIATWEGTHEP